VVRSLVEMDELVRVADLFAGIWGYPRGQLPVTPEMLRALTHAGNYVAGAWVDGALVGASAGFLGRRDDVTVLHSHISGVVPAHQGSQVGYELKQHQRAWAIEREISTIEWTFDPLIRRNAYFNLAKLRAVIVAYEPDFYGAMRDEMNAGEETDRVVARWNVHSPSASPADVSDAQVILSADTDRRPIMSPSDGPLLRAWIPEDYLRDRAQLKGWRQAVRSTLGAAISHGYVATDMTRDGWYTLAKSPS
jgi:predicted GNAT superfamily acetyltransferase